MVVMQGERGEASIRKGVRQGCSALPPVFNLYPEEDINEIKGEIKNIGIKFQGKKRTRGDVEFNGDSFQEL